MTNDPKAQDSHTILSDMDKAHEEQPGEVPAKADEQDGEKTEHAPREDD